jgi:TonB family protein
VGNTLQTKPKAHARESDRAGSGGLAPPVPVYEVTKTPLPRGGTCPPGPYTDEAREAGLEGTVILSFVVDERGRVRDIKVLQGLGLGLTEATKRAVQACAFSPGERDGKPVPTRIPSFKVRFSLRENE